MPELPDLHGSLLMVTAGRHAALGLVLGACAVTTSPRPRPLQAGVEAISLLGDTLRAPTLPAATRADYDRRLIEARVASAERPSDPDALIWLGRRTAYLGRYREAIDVFTRGAELFPRDARFLRHRGHRYITVRMFDAAARDLERAAQLADRAPDEIEPDGLPNARNIPTSTLKTNIFYHLGLARYLQGRFEAALRAYERGVELSTNPDMRVAMTYWRYLTLRRLGRDAEALELLIPVTRELDVFENTSYHRMLLAFKGELPLAGVSPTEGGVDRATVGYGLGAFDLVNGRAGDADRSFRQVLSVGSWAAFGHIAAEAELARMR